MNDIGSNDDVEAGFAQREDLLVPLEIEGLKAHERITPEALAGARYESWSDISEGVFHALGREPRHHMGSGAASAGADLKDAQLASG